jgi:rubrerythrin
MKSLKGTKTEKNALLSFVRESQARNRYSYFASQAKEEGYERIAANSWAADMKKSMPKYSSSL